MPATLMTPKRFRAAVAIHLLRLRGEAVLPLRRHNTLKALAVCRLNDPSSAAQNPVPDPVSMQTPV